jgi:hypothetical protein
LHEAAAERGEGWGELIPAAACALASSLDRPSLTVWNPPSPVVLAASVSVLVECQPDGVLRSATVLMMPRGPM